MLASLVSCLFVVAKGSSCFLPSASEPGSALLQTGVRSRTLSSAAAGLRYSRQDPAASAILALDTNSDGRIDTSEIAAYAEKQGLDASVAAKEFSSMDLNGDGTLDSTELQKILGANEAESEMRVEKQPSETAPVRSKQSHAAKEAAQESDAGSSEVSAKDLTSEVGPAASLETASAVDAAVVSAVVLPTVTLPDASAESLAYHDAQAKPASLIARFSEFISEELQPSVPELAAGIQTSSMSDAVVPAVDLVASPVILHSKPQARSADAVAPTASLSAESAGETLQPGDAVSLPVILHSKPQARPTEVVAPAASLATSKVAESTGEISEPTPVIMHSKPLASKEETLEPRDASMEPRVLATSKSEEDTAGEILDPSDAGLEAAGLATSSNLVSEESRKSMRLSAQHMTEELAREEIEEQAASNFSRKASELHIKSTSLKKLTMQKAGDAAAKAAHTKANELIAKIVELEEQAQKAEVRAAALHAKAKMESDQANELLALASKALR